MGEVSIRELRVTDKAAWEQLWKSYLEFYQQELPPEQTDELFKRLLATGFHDAFVAVKGDRLVGFVHYLFHDSTWSLKQTCYLEDLYVSPDIRGGGVGRKLIEAVYAAAEAEPGASGAVYWHTNQDNERARLLYDRIGVLSDYIRYVSS
ncbi:MAG: GNAT family N-acetyltransferase [Roseibium sp.]|uniref:GNAT family N-acetyltransferase n=1 Tax=Roseibium sp. TaxID=1936156 RepID=UPI002607F71F|nr:GNAT family N-acetyltransferase [Roseibium sp.]MCV0428134.1 GNAT family N-acetyltransferase [Roseibium sp.]